MKVPQIRGPETRGTREQAGAAHRARGRIFAGAAALGAIAVLTGCGFAAATVTSTAAPTGATVLVECRSEVVTEGGIQTSSLSVTKVDAGDVADLPAGCRVVP